MAWNQPGNPNNNPWGKKPAPGGGDFDQAFKDWQKRIETLFGGSGSGSATPILFIGVVILVIWMASGLYQVQPGNQGVVQRFGKHVQTVGDGWGWRLPWPIEIVTKVDVAGVKSIEYKSSVLTAEPNMVELQVAVQYRIKNAEENLFKVRDPAATLAEVSESAIREVVGRNDQQAILEAGRIKIAEDTRVIMQRTLDQYGAGIEVRSVNFTDVQVPEAVQQAQRDSVKAKADRERMIKEAQAYANGILPKAQGDAARAVQEAEAYKSQVTLMATGDASRFTALSQAYERSPAVTRERLYIETLESVLKSSRKVVIDSKSGSGNMLYLPLDKLMDRRDGDISTVTVRPPVSEADASPAADSRQRVER
jgi:membrane protease subunit HflK